MVPASAAVFGISYNNPIQRIREDFGTTRVDHVFSEHDTLFGVYTVDDSADDTPTINPLSSIKESLREQVVSLEETHVFSPRVLNTARFGFSRGNYYFTGSTPVDVPGWVEGAQIGALVVGGSTASNAATQLSPAGTNVGSNTRAARNLFTYEDQVAVTIGKHQIQTGAWIQRIQANDIFAQGQYGQAGFSSLASFLSGSTTNFTAVPNPTMMGWRALRGRDSCKTRSRLRLILN